MNHIRTIKYVLLCLLALLVFSGCGASTSPATVGRSFLEQRSVTATISLSAELEGQLNGTTYSLLRQQFTGQAQLEVDTMRMYLAGEEITGLPSGENTSVALTSYGTFTPDNEPIAYYCYDGASYIDQREHFALSYLTAPAALHLEDYERSDRTETLYGSLCDVYTGVEFVGDEVNLCFGDGLGLEGSLDGALIDVTLWVFQDTNLPARMMLDYSNLSALNPTFSDEEGNTLTLTALSYEIVYDNYGGSVHVAVPDEIKAEAKPLASLLERNGFSGEPISQSGNYLIYSPDGSGHCEISLPEYMEFYDQSENEVSFYYFYSADDYETIRYTLLPVSPEEEAAYAATLTEQYVDASRFKKLKSTGVQTLTIGEREVHYNVVTFTLTQDGTDYDVTDIFSWIPSGLSGGCLEAEIINYDASGKNGTLNVESELEYAYGAIVGIEQE